MQGFAITLVRESKSDYSIVRPANSTVAEIKAAEVLQNYLYQISGAKIVVITDVQPQSGFEILIGDTNRSAQINYAKILNEGFHIKTHKNKLTITGKGRGVLYGVYSFLEEYLGCRKYTATFKVIPSSSTITIPEINNTQNPRLNFRSVYFKDSETDQEYLDWHKLNRIDDKWGLWGHTFFKFLPVKRYFTEHPEYYSLVDGVRTPMQLCLTNSQVLKIVIEDLGARIKEEPTFIYWSVSQNDESGGCECENCTALNDKYHSSQGSLLTFVNKVASNFPDKIISTLAYTYTRKPPEGLKPLKNVNILLSDIEINRSTPIGIDPRASTFRKDFENWQKLTNNIIIWDYVAQFTNYISPFPNLHTLKPNLDYFIKNMPEGFFIQGSVEVASEFSELRTYILSKLLWNPKANEKTLRDEFLNAYYGKAAGYIQDYINLLHANLQKSGRRLDIYDNPIIPYKTYLTPKLIDEYSAILDKASDAVEGNQVILNRVLFARLPLDFAVLQQARFYGIEQHGVFAFNGNEWILRPEIKRKTERFVNMLKQFSISQLNENGLTPDEYEAEWNTLFREGPKIHKAVNRPVTLLTDNDDEFIGKGARTLVDGTAGNNDFQYNWLGWAGNNMEVVIDLQAIINVSKVEISFLENHRHNMFIPLEVKIEVSKDGEDYKEAAFISNPPPVENSIPSIKAIIFKLNKRTDARYIKVSAINQKELPQWRKRKNRKPWILTDEIIIK